MFGLSNRRQQFTPATSRRTRLLLEALEGRDCPTSGNQLAITLTATPLTNSQYMLSGTVTGEDPEATSTTITFTGLTSATATSNADGAFLSTASFSSSGDVFAYASDDLGHYSEMATAHVNFVVANPLTITLAVIPHLGTTVTLEGKVSGAGADWATVTFSGVAGGSVSTNGYGDFSFDTQASGPGSVTAVARDMSGHDSDPATAAVVSALRVTLGVTPLTGNEVLLSGQVTGRNPAANTQVSFGGVTSGVAWLDANDRFAFITTASGLGWANAFAFDNAGAASTFTQAKVEPSVPTFLSFNITHGSGRWVTLTGQVAASDAHGLTVTFTGSAAGTAVTSADGTFSVTTLANSLGTVRATVADAWGQTAFAEFTLTSPPPVISTFSVDNEGDWIFIASGRLTAPGGGQTFDGWTAVYSGPGGFDGRTSGVNEDGEFWTGLIIPEGTFRSNVSVTITDCWGQTVSACDLLWY